MRESQPQPVVLDAMIQTTLTTQSTHLNIKFGLIEHLLFVSWYKYVKHFVSWSHLTSFVSDSCLTTNKSSLHLVWFIVLNNNTVLTMLTNLQFPTFKAFKLIYD